jgi:selenocysteine-specific elongation factor
LYSRRALDDFAARALELTGAHQARFPLQWGMGKEELRQRLAFPHPAVAFNRVIEVLATSHPLFVRGDRVRAGTPGIDLPPGLAQAVAQLNDTIRAAGVAFPQRAEIERAWTSRERVADAIQLLRDAGEIIEVGEGVIHVTALERCLETLRGLFAQRRELTVADLRDALGITRRHAVPLLEFLDARRVTVRKGDVRVPGSALEAGGPRSE